MRYGCWRKFSFALSHEYTYTGTRTHKRKHTYTLTRGQANHTTAKRTKNFFLHVHEIMCFETKMRSVSANGALQTAYRAVHTYSFTYGWVYNILSTNTCKGAHIYAQQHTVQLYWFVVRLTCNTNKTREPTCMCLCENGEYFERIDETHTWM